MYLSRLSGLMSRLLCSRRSWKACCFSVEADFSDFCGDALLLAPSLDDFFCDSTVDSLMSIMLPSVVWLCDKDSWSP